MDHRTVGMPGDQRAAIFVSPSFEFFFRPLFGGIVFCGAGGV